MEQVAVGFLLLFAGQLLPTAQAGAPNLRGGVTDISKAAVEYKARRVPHDIPPRQSAHKYHVVFSAECKPYMDWQSLALYESWKTSGQPGYFTRLLSCSEEELKTYKWLDICPTHVHPPYNQYDPKDWYPPYNLPGSMLHWVTNNKTDADWVIKLDGDMLLRKPITVEEFDVTEGNPIGAYYGYLVGVDNGMSHTYLGPEEEKYLAHVGGWELMHINDLRKIAPKWFEYTAKVRTGPPEAWKKSGDAYMTKANPKPWISEMYGFVFGAAAAHVKHREDFHTMLYPGYKPWSPESADPHVLHYGLEAKIPVGNGVYKYDKHNFASHPFDALMACPGTLFPEPPDISFVQYHSDMEKRGYELTIEMVTVLNEALMKHHIKHNCIPRVILNGLTWNSGGGSHALEVKSDLVQVHPGDTPKDAPKAPKTGYWHVMGEILGHDGPEEGDVFITAVDAQGNRCERTKAKATQLKTGEVFGYELFIKKVESSTKTFRKLCHFDEGDIVSFRMTRNGAVYDFPDFMHGIYALDLEQVVDLDLAMAKPQVPEGAAVTRASNELRPASKLQLQDIKTGTEAIRAARDRANGIWNSDPGVFSTMEPRERDKYPLEMEVGSDVMPKGWRKQRPVAGPVRSEEAAAGGQPRPQGGPERREPAPAVPRAPRHKGSPVLSLLGYGMLWALTIALVVYLAGANTLGRKYKSMTKKDTQRV